VSGFAIDDPARAANQNVLLDVGGNVLLRRDRVLVQVRSGALTAEVLGAIEITTRHLLQASKDPVGFVSILEVGAPVVEAELRARQRAVITELLTRGNTRLVAVIIGEGVGASLRRTLVRTTVLANPRIEICATPADAARVMNAHTGMTMQSVSEAIADARVIAQRAS
jgi:hypothetical protein